MHKICCFAVLILFLTACEKSSDTPSAPPIMHYTDLQNAEVKVNKGKAIDIDGNGSFDFSFGTLLVGDPILQRDRLQFYAYSKIQTYYLNNAFEETPRVNKGQLISLQFPGFEWNEIAALVLAEKITFLSGETFWDGLWKNAAHHYLPLHIKKNDLVYFGWIELSFDTAGERLILHKAGICTEAGKTIKAGE